MMYPQVLISGLILLPVAVDSFPQVHGVVGHTVTLPCTYPVSNGMSSMCWGRGECTSDTCGQTLIWTDGYKIYYWTNNRYQLKSPLLQGNASLTIESVAESDSGVYCCRVEAEGWNGVQSLNISLQVQPGVPTSSSSKPKPINAPRPTPRRPATTKTPTPTPRRPPITTKLKTTPKRPPTPMKPTTTPRRPTFIKPTPIPRRTSTTIKSKTTPRRPPAITKRTTTSRRPSVGPKSTITPRLTTILKPSTTSRKAETTTKLITTSMRPTTTTKYPITLTRPASSPKSTGISASTSPTSAHTQTHEPVWISTVTSSPNTGNIHTEENPTEPSLTILTKGFYIGISVSAVLLILASILTIIQCRRMRKKKTLQSNSIAFHAYRNEAFESEVPPHVEDTVSVTEDGFQPTIKSQLPSEAPSPQSCRKK